MINAVVFLVAVVMFGPAPQPDLLAAYKSGTIRVVSDPAFGAKTEWDFLFKTSTDR
ncbi:MAG: hypothetical protein IMZ54_04480, partial [Acidobacteria bacterium]|nr:hypothetical protein [Acidobacteriota bacterium]